MSSIAAPSFCAWRTREFMKTVQREPRSTGLRDCSAARAELVHLHVERLREALEEGAAARGAGFVEEYAVDDAVLDAQAFHILPADVYDEVRARKHEARGARVRDRLDLADVDAEGRLYQLFAVAGDAARLYRDGLGHQRIELGEHLAHRLDRLADAVDFIAREEQLALRAYEHDLRRR